MRKLLPITIISGCFLAASLNAAQSSFPQVRASVEKRFEFKDASGKTVSEPLVEDSAQRKLPAAALAKIDPSMNPVMMRAATIAQERARAHSKSLCWRYVKEALLAAGAVTSYPKTALAKQAANELVQIASRKRMSARGFMTAAYLNTRHRVRAPFVACLRHRALSSHECHK